MRLDWRAVGSVFAAGVALAFTPNLATAQSAPSMRYVPAHGSNYTARSSRTIDRIVIHTIEGPESSAISWFRNPRSNVSAHYVVSYSGRITRMLRDSDIGWHVRGWNSRAIGIESEGYAARNGWTTAQLQKIAQLTAYLCARYRIPVDRTHIVGHIEVPGNNHSDPGPHFPWSRFMNMVRGGSSAGSSAPTPTSSSTYVVRSGDTLSGIASRYGVSVSELVAANNLRSANRIYVGQRLLIPGRARTTAPTASAPPSTTTTPSTTRSPGARGVSVTASALNVRNGIWGAVIGSASFGDPFVLTGRSNGGWHEIHYRGGVGWLHGGYLKGAGGTGLEVTASALRVRSGAGTSYGGLGVALRGQRYFQMGSSGDWRRIQFADGLGWSHGSYLRAISVGP